MYFALCYNKTEKIISGECVRPVANSTKVWGRKVTVVPKYKAPPCCPACGGPVYLGDTRRAKAARYVARDVL